MGPAYLDKVTRVAYPKICVVYDLKARALTGSGSEWEISQWRSASSHQSTGLARNVGGVHPFS